MPTFEGNYDATHLKFAIVVSRFNQPLTQRLLEGALDGLCRHGANEKEITVAWVPGAFEIPIAAKQLAETKKYHAIIALGAVIRGQTIHFELVAEGATNGIREVSLATHTPIIFSILATENKEQAEERAGIKHGNAGFQGALAAIEMANLLKVLK